MYPNKTQGPCGPVSCKDTRSITFPCQLSHTPATQRLSLGPQTQRIQVPVPLPSLPAPPLECSLSPLPSPSFSPHPLSDSVTGLAAGLATPDLTVRVWREAWVSGKNKPSPRQTAGG